MKSFVVIAPLHNKDDLYDTSFWSNNVGIRRFDFVKNKEFLKTFDEVFQ